MSDMIYFSNGKSERPETLTSLAQTRVEQLIFNGLLVPGDKVKEAVIASQIGFSRGPVREACRSLVGEGLLVSIPQQGVFVRDFTSDEISDLYDIRGHLGLMVGKLAAEAKGHSHISELGLVLEKMKASVDAEEEMSYFRLTIRFNDLFLAATGNSELTKIYRRITRSIRLYRMKHLHVGRIGAERNRWLNASFNESISQRELFLDALTKRDGNLAGALLRRHAEDSRQRTLNLVAQDRDSVGNGGSRK